VPAGEWALLPPTVDELIPESCCHEPRLDALAGAATRVDEDSAGGTGDVKHGLAEAERTAAEGTFGRLTDVPEKVDKVSAIIRDDIGTRRPAEPGRAAIGDVQYCDVGGFEHLRKFKTFLGNLGEDIPRQDVSLTAVERAGADGKADPILTRQACVPAILDGFTCDHGQQFEARTPELVPDAR
jgi:hypothetical protein